jgi:mRNA interferase RelE/StbE
MLKISLSKQAEKFLLKIPKKHAIQITQKIDKLAEDSKAVQSEQLEGYPKLMRAKSGEYRFIFRIENEQLLLLVLRVGKRNDGDVYKGLDTLDQGDD